MDIEAQIAGKKEELTRSDEALHEAEIEYHRHKSRLDALVNMTERYEGFGGAIRRVMQEKDHNPGVIGVVADLIKTEPKYETAIETALGGSIQNIVADNEETVKHLIGILKSEMRQGDVPAADCHPQSAAVQYERSPGGAGCHRHRGHPRENRAGICRCCEKPPRQDTDRRQLRSREGHQPQISSADPHGDARGRTVCARRRDQRRRVLDSSNLLGSRREIAELKSRPTPKGDAGEAAAGSIEDIKKNRNHLRMELENARMELQQKIVQQNTARLNVVREKEKKTEYVGSYEQLRDENRG